MNIQHRESGHQGAFFIEEDGYEKALMTYRLRGKDTMIIDHTEVDEELQGKHIGVQLVITAVEHARNHHQKIMPQCTFAKSVFDKMPELQDVLD